MASTARAAETQAVWAAVSSTLPMLGSTGSLARLWPRGLLKLPSAPMAPRAISCSKALSGRASMSQQAHPCTVLEGALSVQVGRCAHAMWLKASRCWPARIDNNSEQLIDWPYELGRGFLRFDSSFVQRQCSIWNSCAAIFYLVSQIGRRNPFFACLLGAAGHTQAVPEKRADRRLVHEVKAQRVLDAQSFQLQND